MKVSALFIIALIAFSSPIAFAAEEQQKPMTEKEMQEQIKKLEKELAEIRKTNNPQERRQLMDQHMQHMQHMMGNEGGCGGHQ